MAYTLKQNLAARANYGSSRSTSKIIYLILHFTANDGDTDEANGRYFKNKVVKASANYIVDDDSVTQSVPDNYIAYAVGGSKWNDCAKTGGGTMYKKITNANSISIEMCDTLKDGKNNVSEKTLENTLALCKVIMKKYNISINNVYRHFDVTGKHCPVYFMDNKAWADFKIKLQKVLSESNINNINTTASSPVYTQDNFIADVCKLLGVKNAKEALSKTITISATINKNNKLVTPLERYMKALGYYSGSIEADNGKTPSFGPNMTKAVMKYQTYVVKFSNTKNIDGVITAGKTTWKKLLGL